MNVRRHIGVMLAGVSGCGLVAARSTMRDWGATKAECHEIMPGDELVPAPATVITRAVTIDAPAAAVWPWLVQIGQNRAGMYSYDRLENAVGLDIHSANEIKPEWQDLAIGDSVVLVRPGWLGLREGLALPVVRVEPGRSIVLYEQPWHAVWSFHVRPHGPGRCRLVTRSRAPRAQGLARVGAEFMDPITFVMTRKMLLGIKRRAEGSSDTRAASSTTSDEHERNQSCRR